MNTEEALKIFGYTGINTIDKKQISKKYKKLMKKFHPDNLSEGDSLDALAKNINEAYDILKNIDNTIHNEGGDENRTVIRVYNIDFKDLIDIHEGKEIVLCNTSQKKVTLNLENLCSLNDVNIHINLSCNIETDTQEVINKNFIALLNKKGYYRWDMELPISFKNHNITMKICNKSITFNLRSLNTTLNLKYSKGIKLDIQIRLVKND